MTRDDLKKVLILAGVVLVLPWLLGLSEATSYYSDVLVFVAIHSIIATGLTLLLGFAGQISLGQAAFYGVGAYTSGLLTTKLGLSPWLGMPAGMALAGGLAYVVGMPALRLKGHYLAMATLGFGMILYIVFNEYVSLTGGPSGFGEIPQFNFFGLKLDTTLSFYYFAWSLAVLVLAVSLNIVKSRPGRALRAIHDSEIAAQAMGVDTAKAKLQIFVLSGMLGAMAGSLYAHFVSFINPPPFDIFFSLKVLMMVVIGGIGSVWGALIGAVIITFLPEWLAFLEDFDVLANGLILLVIVVFSPDGLAGIGGRLLERLRSRRRASGACDA